MLAATGLTLQIVGALLAGWVLVGEFRARRNLSPLGLPAAGRRRLNPWEKRLTLPSRHPLGMAEYRYSAAVRRANNRYGSSTYPAHPSIAALGEHLAEWLDQREQLLRDDWNVAAQWDEETRQALVELFDQLQRDLISEQDATRARVRIEMFGLFLVLVGTVLSSV